MPLRCCTCGIRTSTARACPTTSADWRRALPATACARCAGSRHWRRDNHARNTSRRTRRRRADFRLRAETRGIRAAAARGRGDRGRRGARPVRGKPARVLRSCPLGRSAGGICALVPQLLHLPRPPRALFGTPVRRAGLPRPRHRQGAAAAPRATLRGRRARPARMAGVGLERAVDRVLQIPGRGRGRRLDRVPSHRRGAEETGRTIETLQGKQMPLSIRLDGRVALVTGASRGIGRAIALALAEQGAKVAVNYVSRVADADAVVSAITTNGGTAVAVRADVSISGEVDAMIASVTAQLGPVDILVNNAGIAVRRGIDDLSEADFDRAIAVNLKSAFLCTKAVVSGMRERGWGRIVNISSGAARGGGVIGPHYNASKAGMEGLMRGYAARLAAAGITVNVVAPSLIETDMSTVFPADTAKRIPVGRMGTPEEVAQVVVMVVANPYMTGQTVPVNGGVHFI